MKNYNYNEEDSYLMYYQANNLYGGPMAQPLPCSSFKWIDNCIDYIKMVIMIIF
jgi:hypothetical protein